MINFFCLYFFIIGWEIEWSVGIGALPDRFNKSQTPIVDVKGFFFGIRACQVNVTFIWSC